MARFWHMGVHHLHIPMKHLRAGVHPRLFPYNLTRMHVSRCNKAVTPVAIGKLPFSLHVL